MTPAFLVAAVGCSQARAVLFAPLLSEACELYRINTPQRLTAFLAQVGHESGSFNYLREVWGPSAAQERYEGRADLGNVQPGDGQRYRGRGLIQITGRANYAGARDRMRRVIGITVPDFEGQPQLLEDPRWAALSAADFWSSRGCNAMADADEFEAITRRINGGLNGLDDRKARWERARAALATTAPPPVAEAPAAPIPPVPAPSPPPRYMPAGEGGPQPQEATMPAFLAPLVIDAIGGLVPSLIRTFGSGSQMAERNAQATELVIDVAKKAAGAVNEQQLLEKLDTDPAVQAAVKQAVHESMGDFLALMAKAVDVDEKTRATAVDRALELGKATGGKWLWLLGIAAASIIGFALSATWQVLFGEKPFSEGVKMLLLGQVVLAGFATVLAFLFGTNLQNRVSQRDQQQREQ